MSQVSIIVQSKNDKPKAFVNLVFGEYAIGELTNVAVMEEADPSGDYSVAMHIKLDNGDDVILEISQKLFERIASKMTPSNKTTCNQATKCAARTIPCGQKCKVKSSQTSKAG